MRYLLIDLSYFVFFRYYALISYLRMSNSLDENTFTLNETFINKFSQLFEKCFLNLLKTHFDIKRNKFSNITVIFARDCSRNEIWRTQLYPEYKATRDVQRKNDLFDGKIFDSVYNDILPRLMKKYEFVKLCSNSRAEADDIIAILSYYIKENKEFESEKVVIITNDNDYLQLLDVVDSIYNLQGKDISCKSFGGCAKKNMLVKVLVGDPSDNIKGIFSKQKTNKLLTKYTEISEIENEFVSIASKSQLESFYLNKKLICFSNIPQDICESVKKNIYDQTFNNSSE